MPFDPWNSSSTGHQVSESRGPHGWRQSRTAKLQSQFRSGLSGGRRISDSVGRGTVDFDEAHHVLISKEARARTTNSVADMLRKPGSMRRPDPSNDKDTTAEEKLALAREKEDAEREARLKKRGILDGMVVYVNGSTHPLISDHRLKRLLAEHGAQTALHLGRRKVTHVILGRPAAGPGVGAGGGLAGGKLEREIRRVGGCAVKYVGVEWVLESIKAGKRLPEARFANLKMAARGQQSVLGVFGGTEKGVAGSESGSRQDGAPSTT